MFPKIPCAVTKAFPIRSTGREEMAVTHLKAVYVQATESCARPEERPGIIVYIHFAGKFVTASGLLESEEVLEIGLF